MKESTALKLVGAALQVMAAITFFHAGDAHVEGLLVPAFAIGIAGLLAWGRGVRRESAAPAHPAAAANAQQLQRVEELLHALQSDVAQLAEDRDFFQRLYAARREEAERIGA